MMYRVRRAFRPLQVEECELSEGLGPIHPTTGPGGEPYTAARVLVRLDSHPLGTVDVALPAEGLDAGELRRAIEARLGPQVRRDGDSAARLGARRAVLAAPPLASVVIPTRERPELLARCLDSVLACDYPADRVEVLVVDNAPAGAGTRELVERVRGGDERVSYLLAPRPGSGSARNDGADRARGEIVAFVDDDVLVDRHWLVELVAGFRAAPDVSCVTGLVVAAELDTWAQQLFEEYGGFGEGFEGAVLDLGSHRPENPLFPFNPGILGSGNNVAFRRAALLELGGYDPYLGNGTPARAGEDWELFLRLFRRGHTAVYHPSAIVHHRHRRAFEELRAQIRDYGVGMGAGLTRTVLREPAAGLELARRLPRAAHYVLSSRSSKNRNWSGSYPRELRRAELAGLALGPARYLRSRLRRG